MKLYEVVVATTKVRIFKQITTFQVRFAFGCALLLLPQRYVFSSKSQPESWCNVYYQCCCCYHKGTYFQANHNHANSMLIENIVVVATTKVRIFKQITTGAESTIREDRLLLLPQRYVFSSKSQPSKHPPQSNRGCCCYHKGTYFQANHNTS